MAFRHSFFVLFLLMAISVWCAAQDQPSNSPRIIQPTLTIFRANAKDQPISSALWSPLVAALHKELASGAPELQDISHQADVPAGSDTNVRIIRGDQIAPGIVVDYPIAVYLHGDCTTDPGVRFPIGEKRQISGPLGWVLSDHGHIKPFIHVDCDRLALLLRTSAYNRNDGDRNQRMATAIAHVIIHEWIHISTQSSHHAREGITKAEFSVADLQAQTSKPHQKSGTQSSAVVQSEGAECSKPTAFGSSAQFLVGGSK